MIGVLERKFFFVILPYSQPFKIQTWDWSRMKENFQPKIGHGFFYSCSISLSVAVCPILFQDRISFQNQVAKSDHSVSNIQRFLRSANSGKNGNDVILEVPLGTVAKDAETGEVDIEITEDGQEVIWVAGGRGGKGSR